MRANRRLRLQAVMIATVLPWLLQHGSHDQVVATELAILVTGDSCETQ